MSETRGFLEGPILSAWIQRGERVDAFEKPPSGCEHELCSSFLMSSFVKARARSVRMCRTTEMNYRERPFEHTHTSVPHRRTPPPPSDYSHKEGGR